MECPFKGCRYRVSTVYAYVAGNLMKQGFKKETPRDIAKLQRLIVFLSGGYSGFQGVFQFFLHCFQFFIQLFPIVFLIIVVILYSVSFLLFIICCHMHSRRK